MEKGKGVSHEPCQPLAVCDYINKLVLAHIPLWIALSWGVVVMCEELCSLRLGLKLLPPVTPWSTVGVCVLHCELLPRGTPSVENLSTVHFQTVFSTNVGGADFQ